MSMTSTQSPSVRRRAAAVVCSAAALAGLAAAPAAPAAQRTIDPALYETELPAGVVEHGVVAFTIKGSPSVVDSRTEYWATNQRWRSRTTDAKTGRLVSEGVGTETSTTYFYARSPRGIPNVMSVDHRSTPPLAGWTAAYNRKLVQRGVLAPVSPATVAGLQGTLYAVPQERKSSDPGAGEDKWTTDDTSAKTEIVLEDGSFWPLVRQTSSDNGRYGTFVQREELLSRERTQATEQLVAQFSHAARQRRVKAWNAKVRAAKARAAKRRGARGR
jgi:hypothetical protein